MISPLVGYWNRLSIKFDRQLLNFIPIWFFSEVYCSTNRSAYNLAKWTASTDLSGSIPIFTLPRVFFVFVFNLFSFALSRLHIWRLFVPDLVCIRLYTAKEALRIKYDFFLGLVHKVVAWVLEVFK